VGVERAFPLILKLARTIADLDSSAEIQGNLFCWML
jgi:predicted ATPase with chaperone activity